MWKIQLKQWIVKDGEKYGSWQWWDLPRITFATNGDAFQHFDQRFKDRNEYGSKWRIVKAA
jgi:hypothetical protein